MMNDCGVLSRNDGVPLQPRLSRSPQDFSTNMQRVAGLVDLFPATSIFRLEHRAGGTLAQHPGEERFLLFRSDRAGAIAKIVFSSVDGIDSREEGDSASWGRALIHVLDVKAEHRGKDFGGLLFTQAMTALLQRYDSVDCRLDAEEDSRRHNRLLLFYKQLGCEVRPEAKVQYVNNNDGETYRKIPMRIRLLRQTRRNALVGVTFFPIQLLGATGSRARLDALGSNDLTRRIHWIILDHGGGHIRFQTTLGQHLRMDEWGIRLTTDEMDDFCLFRIEHVQEQGSNENQEGSQGRRHGLWTLQSAQGYYLTIDCHILAFSKEPAFWLADKSVLSLTCTSEAHPLREHYRDLWSKQTVAYVRDMSRRYSKFELATMTIRQGLNLLRSVPLHKFCVPISTSSPSLRTFSFRAAEDARIGGHPDWVQLIALIHELGCVVSMIGSTSSLGSEPTGYDWTRTSRSRIVGCAAPACASFSEFRHLNADERSFTSPSGIYEQFCGFENVMLTWTGTEYLHHMLKHNDALIPDEGLYILRYFPLVDWHTLHEYNHLANDGDENMKSFVADFYALRRDARSRCNQELSEEECDKLWDSHYCQIAAKYGLLGSLKW